MKRVSLILALVMAVAACGGGTTVEPEPMGAELFAEIVVGGKAGCTSCHSTYPGADGIGPSLAGIGALAATRTSGQSAAEYLRQAIIDPDVHVVDGYDTGVMPKVWNLSDTQIDSLVEYLLGL
jgi:cytochrome c551/c552